MTGLEVGITTWTLWTVIMGAWWLKHKVDDYRTRRLARAAGEDGRGN